VRYKETAVNTLKMFLCFDLTSSDSVFEYFSKIEGMKMYAGKLCGERFIYKQGVEKNRVTLVAHADTYWGTKKSDNQNSYLKREKKMLAIDKTLRKILNNNGDEIIQHSNFYSGLGADDRAGCAILFLLKDCGHNILIVDGEESGYLGVKYLMEKHADILNEIENSSFAIEFDYPGKDVFNCHNIKVPDSFKSYIIEKTGFKEEGKVEKTDISILCKNVYGVNFGTGYYNQHTREEYLNVEDWWNTFDKTYNMLNEKIPLFD